MKSAIMGMFGMGVAWIMSVMRVGRWKESLSRCQFPIWSQSSQTFSEFSFLLRGSWIMLCNEPLPD